MSFAVFWMSAAGIFGSNTKTFGPRTVEFALEVGPPRATTGMTAHSAAKATRTNTVDRIFQSIAGAPQVGRRVGGLQPPIGRRGRQRDQTSWWPTGRRRGPSPPGRRTRTDP